MKICSKCKKEKSIETFSDSRNTKDGKCYVCKECVKIQHSEYYLKNNQVIKEKTLTYYHDNKNDIEFKNKRQEYYLNNREEALENSKRSAAKRSPEERKNYKHEYYENNKIEILRKQREYLDLDANRLRNNKRKNEKFKNDPKFKLISKRRSRRYEVIKNKAKNQTITDLGCSVEEWKQYLETKFDQDMSWDNYGPYWHVDEIIPCSAWNQDDLIEQKACWHYLNSQPLEAKANISKSGANRKDYIKEKAQFLMVLKALDIF